MANQKSPIIGPGLVVLVEVFYLLVLFAVGLIYLTGLRKLLPFTLPDSFGSLSIGVPWFGALGAVIISLSGIVDHRNDWDPSLTFWHFTRPLIGASLAIISVLIFQVGILAVASNPTPSQSVTASPNQLYYLIAFVIGYREEIFRELIKRLADVILTPGGGAPPPVISDIKPSHGKEGDKVAITGSGFTDTIRVKFGPTPATNVQIDSDSQITATAPPGVDGTVSISVTTKSGSITSGEFTYV